jgi:5-methyltetrahydropteroyltriglutamate--homocysteine methyltransferase
MAPREQSFPGLARPRSPECGRSGRFLGEKLPCRLIPGVISHATNIVEHPELVAERIVRLARLVGRENVIASTDCGFAQVTYFARVHPQIMWAKLQALVDGARLASKELWRRPAKRLVAKRAAARRPAAKRPTKRRAAG